jgi:hypothetical protein
MKKKFFLFFPFFFFCIKGKSQETNHLRIDYPLKNHSWLKNRQINQEDSLFQPIGLHTQVRGLFQSGANAYPYWIGFYRQGKKQGVWKHYINDKIVSECEFKEGVKDGVFIFYDDQEYIKAILTIKNDKILGEARFFETGKLKAIVNIKEDLTYEAFYEKTDYMSYINLKRFTEEVKLF